jgi:hypothetical protein
MEREVLTANAAANYIFYLAYPIPFFLEKNFTSGLTYPD